MTQEKYWIAINGSSCAIYASPLKWPFQVHPVPEVLIGFSTLEEAQENQTYLLTQPVSLVKRRMASWVTREDITRIRPSNPEPQTSGQTMWIKHPETRG